MTHASYWNASDGTQLHYRHDDFTDPWKEAPLVVLLHPGLGSSLRLFGCELDIPIMLAVPDPDPMVDRSEYARMRDYVRNLTYEERR